MRESVSGWWRRERAVFAAGFAAVSFGFLGYQWVRLEGENARLQTVNARQCQDISVEARISADTLATQIANSRVLLPKINFPGLTHQQLVALTAAKEAQERRHQQALERVARESCR